MTLRECDVSYENDELQPPQCEILYNEMTKIVWIVKISYNRMEGKEPYLWYCTGFCVHSDGYIATSSFMLNSGNTYSVRSLNDPSDVYWDASWVNEVDNTGIALLKITRSSSDYGKLADVVDIPVGMNVFGIAHLGGGDSVKYCYTFLYGRLVSGVIGRDEVMVHTRGLRMHVKSLNSDIQFHPIYGFSSNFENEGDMRSLGAQVFNSRGHIIGMVVASIRGYDYAVLSSHIKNVINTSIPSKPNSSSKLSTSGRSKKVGKAVELVIARLDGSHENISLTFVGTNPTQINCCPLPESTDTLRSRSSAVWETRTCFASRNDDVCEFPFLSSKVLPK